MSIAELNAEKDHLRAEFAVVQRRLERQVEAAKAERHAEMEEMGRQTMRVGVLAGEVEQREIRVAALERDLAAARAELTQAQAALNETRVARLAAEEALRALEIPYRRALAELDQARGGREETAQASPRPRRPATPPRPAPARPARRSPPPAPGMAGTARDQIQALEDALASLTARNAELEQRLATQKAPGGVPDAAALARIQAERMRRWSAGSPRSRDAVMAAPRPDPRLPAATPD